MSSLALLNLPLLSRLRARSLSHPLPLGVSPLPPTDFAPAPPPLLHCAPIRIEDRTCEKCWAVLSLPSLHEGVLPDCHYGISARQSRLPPPVTQFVTALELLDRTFQLLFDESAKILCLDPHPVVFDLLPQLSDRGFFDIVLADLLG